MTLPTTAAQQIRVEMARCGYTKAALAEQTQISPQVLSRLLSGRTLQISTRNLCGLAKAFGYGTAEFIDLLFQPGVYQSPPQI